MTTKKLQEVIELLEMMAKNCHNVARYLEEDASNERDLKMSYGLDKEGWAYENAVEILKNNTYFKELKNAHKNKIR